jgi:hypothetical protein
MSSPQPSTQHSHQGLLFDWSPQGSRAPWLLWWLLVACGSMVLFSIVLRIRPPEVARQSPRSLQMLVLDATKPEQLAIIHRAKERGFPITPSHGGRQSNAPIAVSWPKPSHRPLPKPLPEPPSGDRATLPPPDYLMALPQRTPAPESNTLAETSQPLQWTWQLTDASVNRRLLRTDHASVKPPATTDLEAIRCHVAVDAAGKVLMAMPAQTRSLDAAFRAALQRSLLSLRFSPFRNSEPQASTVQWLELRPVWQTTP